MRVEATRVLAFCGRAFGLHRRYRPFENLSARSRRVLNRLNGPPEGLPFRLALAQLRYDWDLLEPEAAMDEEALRLQVRLLELSPTVPQVRTPTGPQLDGAPIYRLFGAILLQAVTDSAETVRFDFSGRSIEVSFRSGAREWAAMSIPAELKDSLRGTLRFVEAAGFRRVRGLLRKAKRMPKDVGFRWMEDGLALSVS